MTPPAGAADPGTAAAILCQPALNDLCALAYFPCQWPGEAGDIFPYFTDNLRHRELCVLAQSRTASVGAWRPGSP